MGRREGVFMRSLGNVGMGGGDASLGKERV